MYPKTDHAPKKIHLPCILEASGCGFLNGHTQQMTEQEVSMQFPCLAYPWTQKPKVGNAGVLTFEFVLYGNPREMLRIPCHISYVRSILVGVQINTQALSFRQQRCFADLLKSEDTH